MRVQSPESRVQSGNGRSVSRRRALVSHSTLDSRLSTRRGTTLTEVLMAVLVISVGVLSVMALFPIAFLRALEGTHLTHAVILKQQAETAVDLFGLATDQFIPQPLEGYTTRCVIDPVGWWDLNDNPNAGPAFANQFGIGGDFQPRRYSPFPPLPPLAANLAHFVSVGGARLVEPVPNSVPLRRIGLANELPRQVPSALQTVPLLRLDDPQNNFPYSSTNTYIFAGRDAALSFVSLPDKLETQFTAPPESSTAFGVTFDTAEIVDSEQLAYLQDLWQSGIPLRLVLIDSTGKRSQFRFLDPPPSGNPFNVAAGTIGWAGNQPLPAGFVNNLSEVRVESRDLRYTWMLTIRKRGTSGGSVTEIDCVVFFNRAAGDPEDELVHSVRFPSVGYPDEDLSYIAEISYTEYSDDTRTPPLRKGGYVFDPTYAEWYRVEQILSETKIGPMKGAVVRLDRRPEPLLGPPMAGEPFQATPTLVIPRGVVAVFPMDVRRSDGQRL